MTELLLDWIDLFITRVERDRMVAWHLGVSLNYFWWSSQAITHSRHSDRSKVGSNESSNIWQSRTS